MGRGDLNGTFYVPAAARYVSSLDVEQSQQADELTRQLRGTYHARFADAVFAAVCERVAYDNDNFVVNNDANPLTSKPLKDLGEYDNRGKRNRMSAILRKY